MNINNNKRVQTVLNSLHQDAKKDYLRIGKVIVKSFLRSIEPEDFKHAYLPISKQQGESLRQIIIDNNCKNVIEFGTSFGISTIYMADGVRQTSGKIISTELIESKATIAKQNLKNAGLNNYAKIITGDAMLTLKDFSGSIDFLFLDGWKNLYLPIFKMLEPHFHSGTLIYADNMDMADTQNYGDYVLGEKQKYFSEMVASGKAMLTTCAA